MCSFLNKWSHCKIRLRIRRQNHRFTHVCETRVYVYMSRTLCFLVYIFLIAPLLSAARQEGKLLDGVVTLSGSVAPKSTPRAAL